MKISNWILASTFSGLIIAGGSNVFAQPISHFNVTGVPQTIQPGGASIDVTIEAIGGDGQIVDDWNGEVSLSFLIPQETPVISELENFYNHPSKLEITNPGRGSMDLSGWKIRCLKSYVRHVSPIFEFDLPENTILPPQSVMTFADEQSPDAFGDGLLVKYPGQFPITMFNGVTQLVNPKGNVVDEIFIEGPEFEESFRYDALWTKIYSIRGFIYSEKTIIRHGKDNHFTSDDWIIVHSDASNFGELNPGLELPWEHESLRIPLESEPLQLVDGKWSGSISTPADLPSGSVLIQAHTARGAIGTSTLAEVLAFPKLEWSLPEGFEAASENDAGQIVEAELSIPSSQDTDVTINITSLGVGEFDFPESVTIPAGTTFVKVPFTILDDELVDGLTRLRIVAEAENFQAGELELLSEDNESGELVLMTHRQPNFPPFPNFPAPPYPNADPIFEFEEGFGLARGFGVIGVTRPLVNDLVIHFESNRLLEAPEKVIIPAGRLIQFFDLYVGEDYKPNEYPFINTIKAKVPGWPDVFKEIPVKNNDQYPPTFVEVANVREGFPQTVTVILDRYPLDHNLVYSVTITLPDEHAGRTVIAPETVTLPAGESRTSFEIFFPDNGILDESYNFYLDIYNPLTWGGHSELQLVDISAPVAASISPIVAPRSVLNSETLQIEASLVDPFDLYAGNPVTGILSLAVNSEQIQLIDTSEQIQSSDDLFVADVNWEGSALDVRLKIEVDDMVALSDPIDVLEGLGPSFSILEGLWNGDKNGLVLFSMDVPQIWQFDPKTGNGLGTIQLPSRASFVQHDITNQAAWVGLDRSIEPSDDSIVGGEIIALINLDTFQLEKTIQVDIGERNAVREVHPAPDNPDNADTLLVYADFKGSVNPALMLIGSETGVLDTIPLPDHFLNAELVPGKILGQYFLHGRESIVPLSASSMSININLEEAKTLTPIAAEHFQTSHSLTWIGDQLLRQTGEIIDPSTLEVIGKLVDENILAVVPFQDNQTVALLKDDLEVLYYNLDSQDIELNFTLPRLYFGSPPYVEPGRGFEYQFNKQKGVALRAWGDKGLVVFENNDWRQFTDQNCVFFDGPVPNPASQQIVSIDSVSADSRVNKMELGAEFEALSSSYGFTEEFADQPVSANTGGSFAGINSENNSLGLLSAEEPESRILIFQDVTASEHDLGEVSGIIGMVNHAFSEYTQIAVNVVPLTSQANDFLTLTPTYDFFAGDILGNVFSHPGLLLADDAVPELDEVFRLEFVDTNYNYVVNSTTITIINDDFPEISVLSKPFGKRKSGVYDAEIMIKLSGPAPFPSEVYYQTIPGSALPGEDYFHREGMLTFEPGETEKTVFIPLLGGETDQQLEEFGMQFLSTKGAVYTQPDPSFQIVAVPTGFEVPLDLRWLNENTLEIAFESTPDWTYELKTTDDLVNGEWTKVGGTMNGNGAPIKLFVPVVEGQHFFRVELRIP